MACIGEIGENFLLAKISAYTDNVSLFLPQMLMSVHLECMVVVEMLNVLILRGVMHAPVRKDSRVMELYA